MYTKKKALQIILHENALSDCTRCARWNAYAKNMCPNGHAVPGRKKHCMEDKQLEFFDPGVSHGFKSIVAFVPVGEVRLNFYTVLDKEN
jgi:hypothetical protein